MKYVILFLLALLSLIPYTQLCIYFADRGEWAILLLTFILGLALYSRFLDWVFTRSTLATSKPTPVASPPKFVPTPPARPLYTVICYIQDNSFTQRRITTIQNCGYDYVGSEAIPRIIEWLKDHPQHRASIEPYFDLRVWNLEQRQQQRVNVTPVFPRELIQNVSGLII
jgi:hypothetical protein